MTAALEEGKWSAARPGRTLPPGKTRYPFYRRLGGPQGRSARSEKSRRHRNSIPDRPARSQSLYQLSYPAQEEDIIRTVIQYITSKSDVQKFLIIHPDFGILSELGSWFGSSIVKPKLTFELNSKIPSAFSY